MRGLHSILTALCEAVYRQIFSAHFASTTKPMSVLHCDGVGDFAAFSGRDGVKNNPASVSVPGACPLPPGRYYIVDRGSGGCSRISVTCSWIWSTIPTGRSDLRSIEMTARLTTGLLSTASVEGIFDSIRVVGRISAKDASPLRIRRPSIGSGTGCCMQRQSVCLAEKGLHTGRSTSNESRYR